MINFRKNNFPKQKDTLLKKAGPPPQKNPDKKSVKRESEARKCVSHPRGEERGSPPREKRCPLRWEKMTRAPPRKAPGIFFRNKKIPRGKMPIYKMTRRKNPPASGGFWINAIRGRRGKDALKQARAVRKIFDKTLFADGETGKRH